MTTMEHFVAQRQDGRWAVARHHPKGYWTDAASEGRSYPTPFAAIEAAAEEWIADTQEEAAKLAEHAESL